MATTVATRWRVLDGAAPLNDQPWSGTQPEHCVRLLLQYLRCSLDRSFWMNGEPACERWVDGLRAGRFVVDRGGRGAPGDDEAALYAEVLAALEDTSRSLGEPRLFAFYSAAIPAGTTHLPFVVRVRNQPHSWFVPSDSDPKMWHSSLGHSALLYESVLALDALHPLRITPGPTTSLIGSVLPGSDADVRVYERLDEIARLVQYLRTQVRRDGLRERDRRDLERVTLEALRAPARGAPPPRASRANPLALAETEDQPVVPVQLGVHPLML